MTDREDAPPALRLRGVHGWYGASQVLRGASIDVQGGEIVGLLGRNGSGRSTLLKAVMGLVTRKGSILLGGRETSGLAPFQVARLGVGYVPEGREVFARLTVEQNLMLGLQPARGGFLGAQAAERTRAPWTIDDVYEMFPALRERRRTPAGVLSGGEQQMLTLCRTAMGNPRVMLVDEPTEGLAPQLASQVARFLLALEARGVGVLLVEQKQTIALSIARRCHVMGRGRIVWSGTPAELKDAPEVRSEWLAV